MSSFPALPTRKRVRLIAGSPLLLLLLAGLFWFPGLLQAAPAPQSNLIQIRQNTAQVRYRQGVVFQIGAVAGDGNSLEKATLKVKYGIRGPEATYEVKLVNGSGSHLIGDETENLTTGMPLFYSWILNDGKTQLQTSSQQVFYEDTRQNWRQREGNQLTVRWYDGDEKYGSLMYQLGADTLGTYKRRFNIEPLQQIYITIYGSSQAYHAAFPEAPSWSGGLTRYGGVEIIVIAPQDLNASVFIGEGIPHELSHAALYQFLGAPAPRWLDEGFAVYNQNTIAIKEYDDLVQEAYNANALIPLHDLTGRWPSQADAARLAYAEGRSIVTFLINTYGNEAWSNFLDQLRRHDTDGALKECFGVDLPQMESLWKRKVLANDRTVKMPPALKLGAVASQPTDGDAQAKNLDRTPRSAKSDDPYAALPVILGGGLFVVCLIGGLVLLMVRRYQRLNAVNLEEIKAGHSWQPTLPVAPHPIQPPPYQYSGHPLRPPTPPVAPLPQSTGYPPVGWRPPAPLPYQTFTGTLPPVGPVAGDDPFDLIMASFGQNSASERPSSAATTPADMGASFLNIDPYGLNFDSPARLANQPSRLVEAEPEKL